MMSLCGDGTTPESHEPAIHLVGDEVIGRYEGMNGGTLAVRRGFDGGLDLVLQRSRRAFQIEFSLKQSISGAWSMEGDKHPLNVGFFRDAYSSQQCVLVGNVAYRKAVHENAID